MATLIIGIGTSGLGVLESAQQFNYEFMGKNIPDDVEYVFIDTEESSIPKRTPLGFTSIKSIDDGNQGISLRGIRIRAQVLINNNNFDGSWIPDLNSIDANITAASGRPTYGRLAMWSHFDRIKTFLQNFGQRQGSKTVIVVGSLTGGTGSGICVDLAYLIRHFIGNVKLQSVFMIPSHADYTPTNKVFYENSFQALRSIEYYSIDGNIYNFTTPDGTTIESNIPPYDLVSVVSLDYDINNNLGANRMPNISDLVNSVGLYISSLFLPNQNNQADTNTNAFELIESRRTDATSVNNHMLHFSSFGISMAQYPQKILEEYLALDYSEKIVNHWKESTLGNNKTEIIAKNNMDLHIKDAIDNVLNIEVDRSYLNQYVNIISNQIIDKKFGNHSNIVEYLNSMFLPDGKVYKILNDNKKNARDKIIININQGIKNFLSKEPKLQEGLKYLETTSKYLDPNHKDSLLKYWKDNYKLDGQSQTWTNIYNFLLNQILLGVNSSKVFLQEESFLNERISDIIQLLKMNLLYYELIKIGESIIDVSNSTPLFADKQKLISKKDISNIIKLLDNLLDNNNESVSFSSRQSYIRANNSNFAQIYYYYGNNNFENEINEFENRVNGSGNPIDITGKNVLDGANLIDFLSVGNEYEPNKVESVYFKILPNIINNISNAIQGAGINNNIYSLVDQSNSSYFKNYLLATPDSLENSPPAFMNISNQNNTRGTFINSGCLKLLFMTGNLSNLNSNDITPNNKISDIKPGANGIQIPSLKNTIIAFREYAYFGEINKTNILENTLIPTRDNRSLSHNIKDNILESVKDENFVLNRMPYFNELRNKNEDFNIVEEIKKLASHDTDK